VGGELERGTQEDKERAIRHRGSIPSEKNDDMKGWFRGKKLGTEKGSINTLFTSNYWLVREEAAFPGNKQKNMLRGERG